jgi:excisionase family DNA binding protein
LTVSEAARFANVSIQTLRIWHRDGQLECRRTLGGHRRILRSSLLSCLGIEEQDQGLRGKKVCLYLRVSSKKQAHVGSLKRQRERMLAWVKEKYSLSEDQVEVIQDVASAFGTRTGLQKLVDGIINGEVSLVIAEHQDRLSRVGSELRLIEHLACSHDCKLVFAKTTLQEESDNAYMVRELVDFITVISNRISSRKGAELCRAKISDEVLQRARELMAEGHGLFSAVQKMNEEGWTCQIRNEQAPLSYDVLRRRLREREVLASLQGIEQLPDQIAAFVRSCCLVGPTEKAYSRELYARYLKWCSGEPISQRSFALQLRRMGMKAFRSNRGHRWKGLSLIQS